MFAGSKQPSWKTAIPQLPKPREPLAGSKRRRLFTLRERGRIPPRGLLPRSGTSSLGKGYGRCWRRASRGGMTGTTTHRQARSCSRRGQEPFLPAPR